MMHTPTPTDGEWLAFQHRAMPAMAVLPVPLWKRMADSILAGLLLLAALPLMLLAMLLVKLTSRGSAIYSQTRLGLNRRPFIMYKIRTMTHDCEADTGARWATPDDPRQTLIGRFLRAAHIDELPQLWNVLRGEMSLVGPRPERPEIVEKLEREIPGYAVRFAVRPGITGLAQVQLPPDSSLESVRRKLKYDAHYTAHLTFWLDLRLLVTTAVMFVGIPGRVSRTWLCVPGAMEIETIPPPAGMQYGI